MPPLHVIDPTRLGLEIAFSLIIILLCLLIYFRTNEMYNLTKHKGISYFRNTFLFFSLAYLFRVFFLMVILVTMSSGNQLMRIIHPPALILTGLFSSLAIISLTLSLIWKNVKDNYLGYAMYFIALIISVSAIVSDNSPLTLLILELLLFIFTTIISFINLRKTNKKPNLLVIYNLLFMFWLISIFSMTILKVHFAINTLLLGISAILFLIIFFKVKKWTK